MNPRDLDLLLGDLFEGRLEGEALRELEGELRDNPEARLAYRDHARLHNALLFRAAGSDPMQVVPMEEVVARRQRRYLKNAGLAAAALLVLIGVVMAFFLVQTPAPTLTFGTSPGAEFGLSHELGDAEPPQGLVLEPGSRLEVTRGSVELEFASGVRGIVRGPADLTLVRDDLVNLARGTAWFEVPAAAAGFKVSTPDLILTDLGTQFGILSRPEFLDEVHVFKGRVEVRNRHGLTELEILSVGQARVAGPAGRWEAIPVREAQFLTELPATEPDEVENVLFHDNFEEDSSADYTCVDYHRTGGRRVAFHIDADDSGALDVLGNKTPEKGAQVVHNSATLEVGQTFRVDWLTPAQAGPISQVLTDSVDGLRYCVRLRVNDGAFDIDFRRGHTGSFRWVNNSPYTAPETFWVERRSPTEFAWYRGAFPVERVKIAEITFDRDPGDLSVGVQSYATTAQFDNLAILDGVTNGEEERLPDPDP